MIADIIIIVFSIIYGWVLYSVVRFNQDTIKELRITIDELTNKLKEDELWKL